jgi:hypothetical protein
MTPTARLAGLSTHQTWWLALMAGGPVSDAWQDSATTPVGYPMVNVRDIESGKVRVTRDLFGAD